MGKITYITNPDAVIHYVNGKLSHVAPNIAYKSKKENSDFLWKIVPPPNHPHTEVCFKYTCPFDNWNGL